MAVVNLISSESFNWYSCSFTMSACFVLFIYLSVNFERRKNLEKVLEELIIFAEKGSFPVILFISEF